MNVAMQLFDALSVPSPGEEFRPTAKWPLRPGFRSTSGQPHGYCGRKCFTLSPGQRIVGAGGEVKLRADAMLEQRFQLNIEGVKFRRNRVDMDAREHTVRD
jgi:hypothetical protein